MLRRRCRVCLVATRQSIIRAKARSKRFKFNLWIEKLWKRITILLKLQSRKYKYVTYLVTSRRGARFLYFFTVQLTSIVNYKLPTNILFNSSARYWQISACLWHNATNTIRLCLNFTERCVAGCPDYVLLFRAKPHQTRVSSSIRQRVYIAILLSLSLSHDVSTPISD